MYLQPKLSFPLDALEPYLDKENLDIHYNKHHPTYIKKFNDAVKDTSYENRDLKELLMGLDKIDESLKKVIRNMGGGAWNHSFFWEVMCAAKDSGKPGKKTAAAINEAFGDYEQFKTKFKDAAVGVFGSGWAWLVVNKQGKLEIVTTQNQDCPLSQGLHPILTIDVWEHAYYLKYRNLRPDFVEAFFNVINWKAVEEKLHGK
jgi:superoxide dismutase, Fe-Mn family